MVLRKIRDWWRGYSNADIMSLNRKLNEKEVYPSAVMLVTPRESKAMRDRHKKPGWLDK